MIKLSGSSNIVFFFISRNAMIMIKLNSAVEK